MGTVYELASLSFPREKGSKSNLSFLGLVFDLTPTTVDIATLIGILEHELFIALPSRCP